MKSDPIEIYDLGIIGGGIAGAAIARDAALRGASVALFEKNAFGSGTSGKSSKLIHGGVRYLELAWKAVKRANPSEAWKNFRFVFTSLRESRILRRIAPELVEPLPLIVPIYREDLRKPWMIYAGALLYHLLALCSGGGRSPGVYGSKNAALKALPDLNPDGLLGAVKIWDHWVDDKALVVATIESARKNSALCLENTVMAGYEHDAASNTYLVHTRSGEEERVTRVRKLVNAAGPWVDRVRGLGGETGRDLILPVAGSHLTLKSFLPCSALLQAKDGRFFFVIDHGGTSRVGTTERVTPELDGVKPTGGEVDYLLSSLNRYFPGRTFTKKDILDMDAGVRPLSASSGRNANEIPRDHEIRVGSAGVIHMIGVKLTDHRRAAEEVMNRLVPLLLATNARLRRKTRTHRVRLNGD